MARLLVIGVTFVSLLGMVGCVSTSNEERVKDAGYSFTAPPPPWIRIDAGSADVAFQYPADKAAISVNSVCGQYLDLSLEELRKALPLGFDSGKETDRTAVSVDGTPALRTTTQGSIDGQLVAVTVTVLRGRNCIYDIMLASRPELHEIHAPEYSDFLGAFRQRSAH